MSTGKKIAFIGCSYSSYSDGDQTPGDSWTYQMRQKFPQHLYRNYARGGRGPDYFSWAILDAKKWNADIIFVNSTHPARGSFLIDGVNVKTTEFKWSEYTVDERYSVMRFDTSNIWVSASSVNIENMPIDINNHLTDIGNKMQQYSISSDQKQSYESNWYKMLPEIYNFGNIFVLNFTKFNNLYGQTSNIQNQSVWDFLTSYFNCTIGELHDNDVCISFENDHWTWKGHKLILDEYVLTKEVLDVIS